MESYSVFLWICANIYFLCFFFVSILLSILVVHLYFEREIKRNGMELGGGWKDLREVERGENRIRIEPMEFLFHRLT